MGSGLNRWFGPETLPPVTSMSIPSKHSKLLTLQLSAAGFGEGVVASKTMAGGTVPPPGVSTTTVGPLLNSVKSKNSTISPVTSTDGNAGRTAGEDEDAV